MALPHSPRLRLTALIASPVVVIFLSANLANLGNLAFNLLFSRWMGPVLFGQLATLLTLFLAVMGGLGALQFAVSQRMAATADHQCAAFETQVAILSRKALWLGFLALPVLVAAVLVLNVASVMGLGSALLLPLLLLCLPFALPLCLARGVATGQLEARWIVLSAQIEVWVRLFGSVLAWEMGFGLAGVTAVIALSVLAGWWPLRLQSRRAVVETKGLTPALLWAALPFALLQAGQVVLMDADVVLAQARLGAMDAGQLAALGLFQRIQFFSCFSLVAVLLPTVAREASMGRNPLAAALPVLAIFAGVTNLVVVAACLAPETVLSALVGPAFLPAAQHLPMISIAAAAFTLSYLLATYLAALGNLSGIWAIALACPLQLLAIGLMAEDLTGLNLAKLVCQLALVAWMIGRTLCHHRFQPKT